MSDSDDPDALFDSTRRTFLKASGGAAAALAIGTGATTAAADESEFDPAFANWRVREASKVWERGFMGRQDRPVALTDTGVDATHPDLGSWNGVRAEDTPAGFRLVEDSFEPLPDADARATRTLDAGSLDRVEVTGIEVPAAADRVRAGAFDAGLEENGFLYIEDENGEEIDSNDGLVADYVGVAAPVSADETETITVAFRADSSTGADVEFYVRFFENTAGGEVTEFQPIDGATQVETGTIGPSVTGPASQDVEIGLDHPTDAARVEATLDFSLPGSDEQAQDLDFRLRNEETGWTVASSGNFPGSDESFSAAIAGDVEYTMIIDGFAVAQAEYEVTAEFFEEVPKEDDSGPNRARQVIDAIDDHTDADDKVVGWYNGKSYGEHAQPRDGNGHGTHCSSIMAGSGRASTVETVETDEPHATLAPTDTIEYTVRAQAGTGVFAAAYGTALSVRIEDPDGETIAHSQLFGGGPHGYDASLTDSNIASAPTTHGGSRAEYTVYVTASDEEQTGTPLAARLDRIAVGSFVDPDGTDGDQGDADVETVHAGMAPEAGVVGVQGLGDGLTAFAKDPEFWTREFGVRAVNMSWGTIGGLPFGSFGGTLEEETFGDNSPALLKRMAEGGLLTVAAAGNSFTPANGNSAPAVGDEAISVVATGPLDGISSFSSGGMPAVDEDDGSTYAKPDVTAPGGRAPAYPASIAGPSVYDDIMAAKSGVPEIDDGPRAYTSKGGTSMASPYVNGLAGLVAEAMEFGPEDRDEALTLPAPADTTIEDVMRLKQVILATASETAFTAAPYHTAKSVPKTPTYEHGDRDPYEGYGRVNPDAAVDAVTRELQPGDISRETVGLDVPEDSRAVAGYIAPDRYLRLTVSVEFSHYSGGNKGMAKGDPHLDLFVYDAANPAENGEPNIVASAQGLEGDASVTFDGFELNGTAYEPGTYFVVAKLVNVPGAVNGYDVQANFDLAVE